MADAFGAAGQEEEMAETAAGGDGGTSELTHLAPDIAAHGSVSHQIEGRRASDVDSLEENDTGEHGVEKCTKGSSDGSDIIFEFPLFFFGVFYTLNIISI
jgi:hypothetical protein